MTKLALSKTGRFLSKAEILGVGVFSPLSTYYLTVSDSQSKAWSRTGPCSASRARVPELLLTTATAELKVTHLR